MKQHDLKIMPQYFEDILNDRKTFELRKNDRNFLVGDLVVLKEWTGNQYTGRYIKGFITYLLDNCEQFGLKKGYCIFSFSKQKEKN